MKRLKYANERHQQAMNLQRKLIPFYDKLTQKVLGIPVSELPFQGIHQLRARFDVQALAEFHQDHRTEWEEIAELLEKDSTVETLQHVIDKVNVHAHHLNGETFIQLDYSKQVGRWWNLLTENSRGHVFRYPDLVLASLPLQKFYNLNERSFTELTALNLNQPSYILEKLDGTMIHLFEAGGDIVSATRGSAGVYYFNDKAIAILKNANYEAVLQKIQSGFTPIFEILLKKGDEFGQLVKYEQDELRLIAVRHRESGEYVHPTELEGLANVFGVKCATFYSGKELFHILQEQSQITNMEGWVVYFEDGTMLKVKGEEYLAEVRSRNLEEKVAGKMGSEGDLIGETLYGWIQSGILDDQLAFIKASELRTDMGNRAEKIQEGLESYLNGLKEVFHQHYSTDRKSFALALKANPAIDRATFGLLFEMYKGAPIETTRIKWETIAKHMEKMPKKDKIVP